MQHRPYRLLFGHDYKPFRSHPENSAEEEPFFVRRERRDNLIDGRPRRDPVFGVISQRDTLFVCTADVDIAQVFWFLCYGRPLCRF